jgi:L-asparagine oxygenase
MSGKHSVANQVAAKGYALIRNYCPEESTIETCSRLGIVDSVEGLDTIQRLVPREFTEAPPNTYSGNFGTLDFPLHTDLAHWSTPPRYFALRCRYGASTVATRLFDAECVIREFGTESLRRALVQPRRPMRNGKQLLRLLERVDGLGLNRIRWDSVYLKPASKYAEGICSRVKHYLDASASEEITLMESGDTLIVDNWRALHGRTSANHDDARDRCIERVFLRALT